MGDKIEVTKEQRRRVDDIRDQLHAATIAVLKENELDYMTRDLTETAELIALEGYIEQYE